MMPSATLFVEQSRDVSMNSTSHLLNRTPFTLGRRNRDLTVLNDDNVSREHAEITFENGAFYIRDNNSTHGTYVNGERVQPGGKRAIPDGAEIRLGTTTIMRFKMNPGGMNPGGFSGGYGGDVDKTRPF
jgi:pSer/pThr/pTyr-binding forkhead associated (FHA) protein